MTGAEARLRAARVARGGGPGGAPREESLAQIVVERNSVVLVGSGGSRVSVSKSTFQGSNPLGVGGRGPVVFAGSGTNAAQIVVRGSQKSRLRQKLIQAGILA